jgi:hypothetical protein
VTTHSLLDHRGAEDLVEGKSPGRIEGIPLAGNLSARSLRHRWSPCGDRTRVQLPSHVPEEAAVFTWTTHCFESLRAVRIAMATNEIGWLARNIGWLARNKRCTTTRIRRNYNKR